MIPSGFADYLIIGSGIAGLRAAIELAPHGRVLVLTKADPGAGSTGYAQGGIAAAVGPDDDVGAHAADTIRAGDGLCDPGAVQVLRRVGIVKPDDVHRHRRQSAQAPQLEERVPVHARSIAGAPPTLTSSS